MGRGEALNSVPSTSFGIFPREPVSSRRAFLSGCDYHCNPSSQETPESITGAHLVISEPRSSSSDATQSLDDLINTHDFIYMPMTPKSYLQLYFWVPDHLSNLHSYRPSNWKGPKLTHPASSPSAQTILRPISPPAVSCPSQEIRDHLLCTISSTAFQPPSANHLMPPYHPLRKAGHHHLSWLLPAYLLLLSSRTPHPRQNGHPEGRC